MNELAAWAPTIVSTVVAIFTAGLLVGRIRNQERALGEHYDRLNGHDADLKNHADRLARTEAWREGYSAAVGRVAGGN